MDVRFWYIPIALSYVATFAAAGYTGMRLTSPFNDTYDQKRLLQHRISVFLLCSSVTIAMLFVHGIALNNPHALDHKQYLFGIHSAFVFLLLASFILTIFLYNGLKRPGSHRYFVMATATLSLPVVVTGTMLVM